MRIFLEFIHIQQFHGLRIPPRSIYIFVSYHFTVPNQSKGLPSNPFQLSGKEKIIECNSYMPKTRMEITEKPEGLRRSKGEVCLQLKGLDIGDDNQVSRGLTHLFSDFSL